MSKFITTLEVAYLDDENFYPITPLRYQSDLLGGIIEAEIGFVSDGSSTPRVPIIFELYGDRAHHEGVIHDRIYRAKDHIIKIERPSGLIEMVQVSKSQADGVFKEAMTARNKPWYVREGMWLGVVVGGHDSWVTGFERFKIIPAKDFPQQA